MDLSDALRNAFPDHEFNRDKPSPTSSPSFDFYIHQTPPLQCIYEKRKGKPVTIIRDYQGLKADFKLLGAAIKKKFSVGGGIQGEDLLIQGDCRNEIMEFLKQCGFTVKRVGG